MKEHATTALLRACAASTRIVRAPAKSTSGAARSHHVRGSRAGSAWAGTKNRRSANARFAPLRGCENAPRHRGYAGSREASGRRRRARAAPREFISHAHGSRAGAAWPGTEKPARCERAFRFAATGVRTRQRERAVPSPLRAFAKTRPGAGEESERRRAGSTRARESRGRGVDGRRSHFRPGSSVDTETRRAHFTKCSRRPWV
jgi:hypothetical protein